MAEDLFRMIKGDENNPKGDAVFFCILKKDDRRTVVSVYATNDRGKYIQKAGQGWFDELEKICKSIDQGYLRDHAFQFYYTFIDSEKDKGNIQNVDIIELGEYDTNEACENAIMDATAKYTDMYITGFLRRRDEYFKSPTRFHDNNQHLLNDLNKQERERYIKLGHLVEQMTGAILSGEKEDLANYKRLALRLRMFDYSPKYQETIDDVIKTLDCGDISPESLLVMTATIKDLSRDYNYKTKF